MILHCCGPRHVEDAMQLVADRFVTRGPIEDDNESCAIDLATASPVRLLVAAAGDAKAQREWLMACDDRARVRRFGVPALLDFDRLGEERRFEAWDAESPVAAAPRRSERVPEIALIERPCIAAVAAMLDDRHEQRPRVAAVWGPHGSGRQTVVRSLAQAARRRGFVPIDSRLLDAHWPLVTGRTLFIIDRGGPTAASPWLRALLQSPRAHVCLMVRDEEARGVDGCPIDRIPTDLLIASVRLTQPVPAMLRRVRRAADRAHGLPGRFVRALWPAIPAGVAPRVAVPRVAEARVSYGGDSIGASTVNVPVPVPRVHMWPAPGEVAALQQRSAVAMALIAAGRHAPGIRALRQAISALARRDAWTDALQSGLVLARALLERGRPRDAQRVLDDAREWASKAADRGGLIDVAVLAGVAWTDLARLEEAERVLSGALTAAGEAGDRARAAAARTALSRSMFWRGRYAEALALVDSDDGGMGDPASVRRCRAHARALAACGEGGRAITMLDELRNSVETRQRCAADLAYTSAWVRLAAGDLEGVDRDAAACVAQMRVLRQPMRMLGAHALKAEADRRRGLLRNQAPLLQFFRLLAVAPALTKHRFDLLRALMEAPSDRALVRRYAAATGLKALEILGGVTRIGGATDPFLDDILGILHVCQHADNETEVLQDVCARVRAHVHAATVAFVAPFERRLEVAAIDGARMDPEVAERAMTARIVIAPHRVGERLDAAAPLQYGGAVIGAICARWTLGTPYDFSRAGGVLSMAAAAAAPVLSSALVKRAHAAPPAILDLLGVTPAITELRRSIEAAAAAPFPVLIEGESGSGKELVARAIHRAGPRRDRAFCTLNCAALPDDLVEAELFGHTRGSFTGAVADRPGVFEEAHGGTLFLDEIGELSLRAQAKLLRVIQEGELRRIGENLSRRVDVRIVCATNRSLRAEVVAGRFRQDLLYRLDVVRISVPPLRDRRNDVNVLIDHFWTEATRRLTSRATLSAETRAALAGYDWPGNVRELQNVLAALAVRSPKRGVVLPGALPSHVAAAERPASWRLDEARRSFEEGFVRAALERSGGQRARAAAELGVTRQGLNKLLTRLGIE